MKDKGKILLLSGLTLVTIGAVSINNIDSETLQKSNVSRHVQAYNHNPSNILDNVFERNGVTILPFIYKDSLQTIRKDYIVSQFAKAGLTIQNQSSLPAVITTGTQIKTPSKTYIVIIYGDVNADGYVDVFDSQKIMRHYVYGGNNTLTGVYEIAGNVNNNDQEVDVFDAQRILRFYVGFETKLVVNEPTALREMDKQAPTITLKGNNPQIVRLGDKYVEAGATVSDNIDKNLVASIDASKVNVNKAGTYTVTYTALDKAGNKSSKIRTVKVEDYITGISITNPNKTTYKYGETLDLSGMVVKANMKSGSSVPVESGKYVVSGYNKEKLGEQTINVSYNGFGASFKVKVNDYITSISVTKPNKTTYIYGEELNLNGMVVKANMKSGVSVPVESGKYVVSGYNKETLGEQTINVSYGGHNASFKVTINDYVKDIKVTKMPSKLTYKYGQELELSDMVVTANYAKQGEKVVTNYEVIGYSKETLNDQKVTIRYAGKEDYIVVNVDNYVADIEIVTWPEKLTYIEDESIDVSGIEVNKVMKDGTSVPIELKDIIIEPNDKVTLGDEKIKVIYKTTDTLNDEELSFEKEYKINVLKKLGSIEFKSSQKLGFVNESFLIGTIKSGENEEALREELLKAIITKDGTDVTNNVEIDYIELGTVFDNQIEVKLKVQEIGEYKVIFYVGDNINDTSIKTSEYVINVNINPYVANAEIVINASDKIRVDKFIEKEIVFTNKHGVVLNVEAGSIEFVTENIDNDTEIEDVETDNTQLLEEKVEITKLKSGVPVENDKSFVEGIRIKGKKAGTIKLKAIVNKGTDYKKEITVVDSLTILEKAKQNIIIGDVTDITLYQDEPEEVKDNIVMYNNLAYTLIPIHIQDEDGEIRKIRGNEIAQGILTEGKKLVVTYEGYNAENPFIQIQGFKDKRPITSKETVDSIGIAILSGTHKENFNNLNLQIKYYESEDDVSLPIKVEDYKISELIITPSNVDSQTNKVTGYNRAKVLVGTIKSGAKQQELTIDRLYTNGVANYTVKDEEGNDITANTDENGKKIVEVTYEYDNLSQEILVYVTTQTQGEYTINSYINVGQNKIETSQEIKTIVHPVVTKIEIEDLERLALAKPEQKRIKFLNKYGDEVTVEVANVQITRADGVNVAFLNENKQPTGEISYIELKATKTGSVSMDLTVKGAVLSTINIEAYTDITIDTQGTSKISLYETDPSLDNVKVVEGRIYTLIPISIKNAGTQKLIKGNEIILGQATLNRPVGISYTGYDAANPYIEVKMFKDGQIVENVEEADYLGIALLQTQASNMQRKTITINYEGANPVNITVE